MSRNQCRLPRLAKRLVNVSVVLSLLALALHLRAQDQTIAQMIHTSWTGRDGAPQGITALAQTRDGILWIGGISGLFTFDGVNFAPFNPKPGSPSLPVSPIRFLFVSKSGELWVSPFHGAAICIHGGEAQLYGRVEGDHLDVIGQVQQDASGILWSVLNEKHLVRLGFDGIWHEVANPTRSSGHVSKLYIDSNNTQWVVEDNLLYTRPQGETEFIATTVNVYGPAKIVEDPDRSLWVMGEGPTPAGAVNLQHVDRVGRRLFAPQVYGQINTILVAPDDSLWVNKNEELQRFSARAISRDYSGPRKNDSDFYRLKNGPTAYGLQALLSDADGNMWIGGMGGLDRFEHANLVPALPGTKVGAWHSCVDSQGEVWVIDADDQLFVIKNGQTSLIHSWKGPSNLFCGQEKRGIWRFSCSNRVPPVHSRGRGELHSESPP